MTLPAYQLYYHGQYKHVLRTAMRGILPEPIRARWKPTSLMPLYTRGVQQESPAIETCVSKTDSRWSGFVDSGWLSKRWYDVDAPDEDGPQAVIPWLCVAFEAWSKRFDPSTHTLEMNYGH
jgi:hypothetical protein